MPSELEYTPQDLVWYRLLLELAHHPSAAAKVAIFHAK